MYISVRTGLELGFCFLIFDGFRQHDTDCFNCNITIGYMLEKSVAFEILHLTLLFLISSKVYFITLISSN